MGVRPCGSPRSAEWAQNAVAVAQSETEGGFGAGSAQPARSYKGTMRQNPQGHVPARLEVLVASPSRGGERARDKHTIGRKEARCADRKLCASRSARARANTVRVGGGGFY